MLQRAADTLAALRGFGEKKFRMVLWEALRVVRLRGPFAALRGILAARCFIGHARTLFLNFKMLNKLIKIFF